MNWKRVFFLVFVLAILPAAIRTVHAAEPAARTALQRVEVDGRGVELQLCILADGDGRNINYVKARDLAYLFDGTGARFEVSYDAQAKVVDLLPGRPYTPNGFELEPVFSGEQPYRDCTGTTNINGARSNITAIRLTDEDCTGHTFYALRELCWELGASVGWDVNKGIVIDTGGRPDVSYDYAPTPCDAVRTVDGEVMRDACVMNHQLYLKLPAEQWSTSAPCGKISPRGTSYFSASAEWRGNSLRFDNNARGLSCNGTFMELEATPLYDGTCWYLPLRGFYKALGYTELEDSEEKHLYYTSHPRPEDIPGGVQVPVLMYHAVSDDTWGIRELFVSPSEMEKQLQYLNDNGFTTIFFSDLPDVSNISKPVILTFDDGYRDNYTELFPLLKKYNCKATIFVIAGSIASDHHMDYAQIQEMVKSGLVEIGSHTMTHCDLDTLGERETIYELERSCLLLTRATGYQPYALCYPTGRQYDLTRRVAADYYQFGVLMNGGRYITGTNPFLIPRTYVSRDTDIWTFAGYIS